MCEYCGVQSHECNVMPCECEHLEQQYTDVAGGWVTVVLTCPECCATWQGDIQLEHLTKVSDGYE